MNQAKENRMAIKTWEGLQAAIYALAINDREAERKVDEMEGWRADGYDVEWTAKRMGYRDESPEQTFDKAKGS